MSLKNLRTGEDLAMPRITVAQAERNFVDLVNRVYAEGISVDLARGEEVIARLVPAGPHSALKVQDLNTFLQIRLRVTIPDDEPRVLLQG